FPLFIESVYSSIISYALFLIANAVIYIFFFFSSRRRHTRSVSAFLLNRSSDLYQLFSHIETNSHITGSFKRLTFSINRPQPTRTRKSVLRVANCDGHTVTIRPRILQAI